MTTTPRETKGDTPESAVKAPEVFDPREIRRCLSGALIIVCVLALVFLTSFVGFVSSIMTYNSVATAIVLFGAILATICVVSNLSTHEKNEEAQLTWHSWYRYKDDLDALAIALIVLLIGFGISRLFAQPGPDAYSSVFVKPPKQVAHVLDTAPIAQLEAFAQTEGSQLDAYKIFGEPVTEVNSAYWFRLNRVLRKEEFWRMTYRPCKEAVAAHLASPRSVRYGMSVNGRPIVVGQPTSCEFAFNKMRVFIKK